MNSIDFARELERGGYEHILERTMEPRPANAEHIHDFSVRGLVVTGEFIISRAGVPTSYKAGEVFEVPAGELHNEAVGPVGVTLVTGRR